MREFEFQSGWEGVKQDLAARLREIRVELYGEHGGPMLAEELEVPYRIWVRYEAGVSMPAPVMLRFLEQTGASPRWLLTGDGPKFPPKDEGR